MNPEFEKYCDIVRSLRDAELASVKANKQLATATKQMADFMQAYPITPEPQPPPTQPVPQYQKPKMPWGQISEIAFKCLQSNSSGMTFRELQTKLAEQFRVNPSTIHSAVYRLTRESKIKNDSGVLIAI